MQNKGGHCALPPKQAREDHEKLAELVQQAGQHPGAGSPKQGRDAHKALPPGLAAQGEKEAPKSAIASC